jgi:hypothetical protein
VAEDSEVEEADESLVELAEELSDELESVAVEVVVEPVAVDVDELPVTDADELVSTAVLCAPWIEKAGEKLMLVGSVSSMISMVYMLVFTWLGSMVKVAVSAEAGMLAEYQVSVCALPYGAILTS